MTVNIQGGVEQGDEAAFVLDNVASAQSAIDFAYELRGVRITLLPNHANKTIIREFYPACQAIRLLKTWYYIFFDNFEFIRFTVCWNFHNLQLFT